MPESSQCPQCAAPLPTGWPKALCSRCALQGALELSDGQTKVLQPEGPPAPSTSGQPAAHGSLGTLQYFGDYELLEEIARGGMGIVYKARQKSLDRIVAVKMLLLGQYASEEFIHRFRIEASAAASLQHPNIVAIHEVGVHQGQHYFAMDFVDGPNLAQLVRDQPLMAERAAGYVKTIAEAIHFAHTRRILHRDLKPSNVLIDANDQPRVTDFGLAKKLSDDSDLTVTGQVLGSPSFLPPEQALGERGKMGPASDVYSLGAILYHALTGRPPFVGQTVADTLKQVETRDPIAPRLLIPAIPGDLETICLKCLEKEPGKRYETAQQLADDLGRFLNGEPIQARPVGVVLKVHRWCLRNKALAVAGTTILALLLVVAIGSPIAAYQINRARQQAEARQKQATLEAIKSQQVAQFLKDMLKAVGPSVALGRDTKMLREILDQTVERLSRDLTNQPVVEAELRSTIAGVYLQLVDYRTAEGMYREALRLRTARFGRTNELVAATLYDLAFLLREQGNLDAAASAFRDALAIRRSLFGNAHADVALTLGYLASVLELQGRRDEAEATYREALLILRRVHGDEHRDVALCLNSLGHFLAKNGKLVEAEAKFREALALRRKLNGDENPAVAESLVGLAKVLAKEGKLDQAEQMENEALALFDKLHRAERPDPDTYAFPLGDALEKRGRLAEAESLFRGQLAMRRRLFGDANSAVARAYEPLARVLMKQGKVAEAEALSREMMEARPQDQWKIHGRAGRWKEAAASLRQSIELEPNREEPYLRLAPILLLLDDVDGYRQLCRRMVPRFSGTRNIAEADAVAKACTIHPGSGVDLGAVAEAAETAVTLGKQTGYRPWSELAKSLAEYRQEHFVGAAEWAQKSLAAAGQVLSRDAAAYLVLAMAQMKLKQEPAARITLGRGAELLERKLPKLDSGDLGGQWVDVIIASLLFREAKALIEGNATKPASEVKVAP